MKWYHDGNRWRRKGYAHKREEIVVKAIKRGHMDVRYQSKPPSPTEYLSKEPVDLMNLATMTREFALYLRRHIPVYLFKQYNTRRLQCQLLQLAVDIEVYCREHPDQRKQVLFTSHDINAWILSIWPNFYFQHGDYPPDPERDQPHWWEGMWDDKHPVGVWKIFIGCTNMRYTVFDDPKHISCEVIFNRMRAHLPRSHIMCLHRIDAQRWWIPIRYKDYISCKKNDIRFYFKPVSSFDYV